jgi:ABC-2 type transport system permease protein
MTRLIRAELAKLTTVRAPRWALLAQIALLALAASGAVVSGVLSPERMASGEGLRTLLAHGGVVAIVSLAVGITLSAGEFRHGTVIDTFLTEPRRERATVAELTAGLLAGLGVGVTVAAATVAIAAGWCAAKDVTMDWSIAWRSAVGITVWQALYTVIGVALGALIRAQAAAVIVAVAWLFVVETAVSQLLSSVGRWLPATAASAVGNAPDSGLLTQVGGGLVLAGWTALAGAAAVALTARRDLA